MPTCIGWVELSTRTHQSHTRSILGFALWLRQAMTLRGDLLVCSKGRGLGQIETGELRTNRRCPDALSVYCQRLPVLLLDRGREAAYFNGVAFNATVNHVTSLLEGVSRLYKLCFNLLGLLRLGRRQDSTPRALGDR